MKKLKLGVVYFVFFIVTIMCLGSIAQVLEMEIKEIARNMSISGDALANLLSLINLGQCFLGGVIILIMTILFSSYIKVIKDK